MKYNWLLLFATFDFCPQKCPNRRLRRRLLKTKNIDFSKLSSQIFLPKKKLWLIIFVRFIRTSFCTPLHIDILDKTTFGDIATFKQQPHWYMLPYNRHLRYLSCGLSIGDIITMSEISKYIYDSCDYSTIRKSNYSKKFDTDKHKSLLLGDVPKMSVLGDPDHPVHPTNQFIIVWIVIII